MSTILDRIVETKHREIEKAQHRLPVSELQERIARSEPARDFFGAIRAESVCGIQLIAEVKKASPSAGTIVVDFDPERIATTYHRAGAAAVSVLTDEEYFAGRLEYLGRVKRRIPLPILRKDFIIDEYQVYESRAAGADAVLLIAEILDSHRITLLHRICRQLGLTSLVEVHSATTLRTVLETLGTPGTDGYILGINNRDLSVQHTDIATTSRLAALLPERVPFVTESGIATRRDVEQVIEAGACAMLVGESLLRASDPADRIDELLGRPPGQRRPSPDHP